MARPNSRPALRSWIAWCMSDSGTGGTGRPGNHNPINFSTTVRLRWTLYPDGVLRLFDARMV